VAGSTIREADQILVIEAGQIGESGSHDQLLAQASSTPPNSPGIGRIMERRK